jgi:hypothetical protein
MRTFNQIDESKYQRAKTHVKKIKGFYSHLVIYLVFVIFFMYLNFISTSFPWAIFPIAGWGIGILGHATDTFGWNPFFGKKWEERKLREFMDDDEVIF